MIYFIDEDAIQLRPLRLELLLRNMDTQRIENADEALAKLNEITADDFLFIDVMLAVSPDEEASAFGRDETDGYKTTGLVLTARLFEEISKNRLAIQRDHIVLMSQAASPTTRNKIEEFAKKHKIKFIPKNAFDDPEAFGNEIEAFVKSRKV